jgi:hypothetical protein
MPKPRRGNPRHGNPNKRLSMTHMTSTIVQIALLASETADKDAVLRYVDAIQMGLEIAKQPATADAFVSLSDFIQDGRDALDNIAEITDIGTRAAHAEPDSLKLLIAEARAGCKRIRVGDAVTLFEISALASAISAWMAVTTTPNTTVMIHAEDAFLDIGRAIGGIAITRLSGKVVPARF